MAERIVRHALIRYKVKSGDKVQRKVAFQGQTVTDLSAEEEERLDAAAALVVEGEAEAAESGVPDLNTATVVEVAAWISESRPDVPTTIAAAGDDPAKAGKLLDAENEATGGDPRKGVEDGLTKIIDDAA